MECRGARLTAGTGGPPGRRRARLRDPVRLSRASRAGIGSSPLLRCVPVFVHAFGPTCSKRAETRAGASRVHCQLVKGAVFRQRRVGAAELEAAMPIEHHPDWDAEDDVTWILPPPWMPPERPDPSRDAQPASELLGETEYSATDYFGNEGGDAAFYVCAALLLDVPPARVRPGTKAPQRRVTPKRTARMRHPQRAPRR
jgi:hypothetical protein